MNPQIPEGCTGPFSDAFDCPVHDPRKIANPKGCAGQLVDSNPNWTADLQLARERVKELEAQHERDQETIAELRKNAASLIDQLAEASEARDANYAWAYRVEAELTQLREENARLKGKQ
jgi:hypothetical protein